MAQNNKETEDKSMAGVRNRITRAVVILILVIAALSGKQLLPGGANNGDVSSSTTDSNYYGDMLPKKNTWQGLIKLFPQKTHYIKQKQKMVMMFITLKLPMNL